MRLKELFNQSALYLESEPRILARPVSVDVFRRGGEWMRAWLSEWRSQETQNDGPPIDFNAYGWFKYTLCISLMLLSVWGFYRIAPWLMPVSLIVFYIAEVHFLFLFPLLIDGVEHPLRTSIRITYRIGLLRVLVRVIPIGLFMMIGLLRFSDPFRNWHTGCLAVLIWYKQDVRDRI